MSIYASITYKDLKASTRPLDKKIVASILEHNALFPNFGLEQVVTDSSPVVLGAVSPELVLSWNKDTQRCYNTILNATINGDIVQFTCYNLQTDNVVNIEELRAVNNPHLNAALDIVEQNHLTEYLQPVIYTQALASLNDTTQEPDPGTENGGVVITTPEESDDWYDEDSPVTTETPEDEDDGLYKPPLM